MDDAYKLIDRILRKNLDDDSYAEYIAALDSLAAAPTPQASTVTPAMVDAYLRANDAYWKRTDQLPNPPDKWRTGTPKEATAEGLRAALAVMPAPTPPEQADTRDAARYRHMRDKTGWTLISANGLTRVAFRLPVAVTSTHDDPDDLDAAIDAAMKEPK